MASQNRATVTVLLALSMLDLSCHTCQKCAYHGRRKKGIKWIHLEALTHLPSESKAQSEDTHRAAPLFLKAPFDNEASMWFCFYEGFEFRVRGQVNPKTRNPKPETQKGQGFEFRVKGHGSPGC